MMRKILFILITILISSSGIADEVMPGESQTWQFIVNFDREISGLLDAYLEAVPECPVYPDTPIRLWVLDLAWIRADAAIQEAETIGMLMSDSLAALWSLYLESSREYLSLFGDIQNTYHQSGTPDSAICIELETELLKADSLWRSNEMKLFELYVGEELNE